MWPLLCRCLLLPWGESAAGSGQSRDNCLAFAECSQGFEWKAICVFCCTGQENWRASGEHWVLAVRSFC